MSQLALSDSFEYLCYGFPAIRNILILTVRRSTLVVRIWRLQTSDSVDWSRFLCCKGWSAEIILYKPWGPKDFFKFEIIINVLVSSVRFISIPLEIFFILSSLDTIIWRLCGSPRYVSLSNILNYCFKQNTPLLLQRYQSTNYKYFD